MTDIFDEQIRHDLMWYRMEKASALLREVEVHKDNGFYSTAINRLYYACFNAASALMIKHKLTPGTHAGIKTLLGIKFVKTGLIDADTCRAFSIIMDRRNANDYDDFVESSLAEVNGLIPLATNFINSVKELL